jgi:adenylosuccinate synthase
MYSVMMLTLSQDVRYKDIRIQMVANYQGGNNAGHTIVVGDVMYDFHILPSGKMTPSSHQNSANNEVL